MTIDGLSGRGARLNTVLMGLAMAGLAAAWSSSALSQTTDAPSVQEYQSRLNQLGSPVAPGAQDTPTTRDPRCDSDDPKQFEAAAACGSPVQGATRGFSLVRAPQPAKSGAHAQPAVSVRHPHHLVSRPEEGPTECAVEDTADNRGVNLCVTFGLNSATLSEAAKVSLNNFARALLADRAHTKFLIEGFTDSTGNENVNKTLSAARAKSVTDYLVSQGVPRPMLDPHGIGANQFITGRDHTDPANRRVEARLPNA